MKTIKFYTLGCKVNQYDTQEMREAFLGRGFRELSNGKKAGYYLINTCTVTGRADSASFSLLRKARQENPKAKIIVTGCLTELDSARIKGVDKKSLIVKNTGKADILHSIFIPIQRTNALKNRRAKPMSKLVSLRAPKGRSNPIFKIASVASLPRNDPRAGGISFFAGHARAFLKVQDGCDNFCSYCKVPLVRGRSRSKPLSQIISEAENLAKNGFKEIVLTGICLGAYGRGFKPALDLAGVIEELEKIPRLLRIRLSSIEAADVSDRLIARMRVSKKLCRHLHIPIQSGDNTVLKKMRRSYTREKYLALIKKIKKLIPGIAITTDVLVGFPGEEERHFRNTLELVKKIQPLKAHIFPYSGREGTYAAINLKDNVPAAIIKSRCLRMKSLADACAAGFKKKFLNKKMQVLFESKLKQRVGWWQGYTDNYIKVTLKSRRNLKNKILKIPLT